MATLSSSSPTSDLNERIAESPMSPFQVRAVIIALLLNMVDGYDVLVMPFAAPAVAKEFAIDNAFLGYILSGSLFGMAIGSFCLAPFADKIGRKPLTLISLLLCVVGMALTPFMPNGVAIFVARVIAGLGIGGMVSNLTVIVSEYSNRKHRALFTGLFTAGYPLGATFGGLLAGWFIKHYGWQSAFFAGAAATLLLLVVSLLWMPESYHYLIHKREAGGLDKLNKILVSMRQQPLDRMPEPERATGSDGSAFNEVFGPAKIGQTMLMWIGYGLLIASFYFANSWTPKIITGLTGDPQAGVLTGVLFNVGGALGSVVFGLLAIKFAPRRIQVALMLIAAVCFFVFGSVLPGVGPAMMVGTVAGLVTTAGVAGVYMMGPPLYVTSARAFGFGWLIGVGRLVSITAPIVGGYLLDGGVTEATIFKFASIPLVFSALAFVALGMVRKSRGLDPEPTRKLTI